MQLEDIEKNTNVSFKEIIDNIQYENAISAWVSGSLVEGIGNPSSDIDIFVAVEDFNEDLDYVRKEEDYYINIYFTNSRRVDYEYWPLKRIESLSKKLMEAPISDETKNVLDYFPESEVEFMHRILIGIPIINEENFHRIRSQFNTDLLSQYLIENKRIYIDDAFDDTIGMLESGDIRSAAFRARYTLESSMDLLLFSYNITNHKEKHRIKHIKKLLSSHPHIWPYYKQFWKLATKMPDTDSALRDYIKEALRFTEDIVDDVERRWSAIND
jgi:predicted nucleotidyltransferase